MVEKVHQNVIGQERRGRAVENEISSPLGGLNKLLVAVTNHIEVDLGDFIEGKSPFCHIPA